MKNKFIRTLSALLFIGVLVVGLSACGGNSKSESSTESESKVSETETVSTEETDEAENEETENAESTVDTEDPTDIAGKTVYYSGSEPKFAEGKFPFSVDCPEGCITKEDNVFSETDIDKAPSMGHWWYDNGIEISVLPYCKADDLDYYVTKEAEVVIDGKTCPVTFSKYTDPERVYQYFVYVPFDSVVYYIKVYTGEQKYDEFPYDNDVIKEIASSITPL